MRVQRSAIMLAFLAAGVGLVLFMPTGAAAIEPHFNSGPPREGYRHVINFGISVDDPSLTNYAVPFLIDTATPIGQNKMQSACQDLRFALLGQSTFLPYYLEGPCNSPNTTVWVKFSQLDSGFSTNVAYYYGDATLTNASDPNATFTSGSVRTTAASCSGAGPCGVLASHSAAETLRTLVAGSGACPTYRSSVNWGNPCTATAAGTNTVSDYGFRYRFLFVPDVTGTWTIAELSDDYGEVAISTSDSSRVTSRTGIVSNFGSCTTSCASPTEQTTTLTLTAGNGVWFDYVATTGTSLETERMRVARPGGSLTTVDSANFPGMIFARTYTTSEPIVNSVGTEQTIPNYARNIAAVASPTNTNHVTWSAPVSNGQTITSYMVYWSSSQFGTYFSLANLSAGTFSYDDVFGGNASYNWYRVTAWSANGEGPSDGEAGSRPGLPFPPGSLVATPDDGSIQFDWNAPPSSSLSQVTQYKLYCGMSPGGEPVTANFTTANGFTLTATLSGLTNGLSYYCQVRSVNAFGTSNPSNEVVAVPSGLPFAPDWTQGVALNHSIAVTWPPAFANGAAVYDYWIYKGTSPTGLSFVGNTGGSNTSYTINGLTNGTKYYFVVYAVNANGVGPGSGFGDHLGYANASGRTDPPAGLLATAGNNSITLQWAAGYNGGTPLWGYEIRDADTNAYIASTANGGNTSFTVNGLTNGVPRHLAVSAYGQYGGGDWWNPAIAPVRTPTCPGGTNDCWYLATDIGAPPFSVTTSNVGMTTEMNEVASCNANTYDRTQWWRWTAQAAGTATVSTVSASTNYDTVLTAYTGATLASLTSVACNDDFTGTQSQISFACTAGTTYWIQLGGFHGATGNAGLSISGCGVPGVPNAPTAVRGNRSLSLSWAAASANGGPAITNYKIHLGTTSGGESFLASTGGSNTSFVVNNLANGTTYYVKIAATNSVGDSALSLEASGTPASLPDPPASLAALRGDAKAALSWTPGQTGGLALTGYSIWNVTTTQQRTLVASTTDGSNTSFVVNSLTNGYAYKFNVSTANAVGSGLDAGPVAVTPARAPFSPTGFTATPGNRTVALAWVAPDNGGDPIVNYDIGMGPDVDHVAHLAFTGGANTSFVVNSLTNGTSYVFRVAGVNGVGTGGSITQSATPLSVADPPYEIVATPGNRTISLSWTAPPSNGGSSISGYDITDCVGASCTHTQASGTTQNFVGLANGSVHVITIASVNGLGTGNPSPSVTVTPIAPPDPPLLQSVTPGNRTLTVRWAAGQDNGFARTGFDLYANGALLKSIPPGNTSDVVSGLTNGTPIQFNLTQITTAGRSASSFTVGNTPFALPDPPTFLQAVPGNRSVTLTWGAPLPDQLGGYAVVDYQIWMGASNGAETRLARTGGANTSFVVNGLTNGTLYWFNVSTATIIGESLPSGTHASATPSSIPDPPRALALVAGNRTITATWTAPASNGGFAIDRYDVTSCDGPACTTLPSSTTSLPITGLANGTTYTVTVTAHTPTGSSAPTGAQSATPITIPDPPAALAAARGDRNVTLAWTPGITGGAALTGYKIWNESSGAMIATTTNGANTSFVVNGLTNGVGYAFHVTALAGARESLASNGASAIPATTPGAPVLTVTFGDGNVTLSWTQPNNGGDAVTSHEIRMGTSPSSLAHLDTILANRSYVARGLTNGVSYTFQVVPTNTVGAGLPSNTPTTIPAGLPSAPPGLGVVAHDGSVDLTWDASNGRGRAVAHYNVYAQDGTGPTIRVDQIGTNTSYVVHGLVDGDAYTFTVRAVTTVGEGPGSSVSATPIGPPAAPDGVTATQGQASVTVTWNTPSDHGSQLQQYRIWGAATPGGHVDLLQTISATITTWTDPAPPASRYYSVTAVNAINEGPRSAEALGFAQPQPLAPTPADTYRSCQRDATTGTVACTPGSTRDPVRVFAGARHTCVLLDDARVDCYGDDSQGQAGDHLEPDALSVSAGAAHTCILRFDHNVDCYGSNAFHKSTSYLEGNAVEVAAGGEHTCIRRADSSVACFGANTYGQVAGLASGATQIAAGRQHTCAVLDTGDVTCWGRNDDGQSAGYASTPDAHAVQVVAGDRFSCARLDTGAVTCWGRLAGGAIPTSGAVEIAAGQQHACARLANGNVACWGYNGHGQAAGDTTGGAVSIAAGDDHTCVVHAGATGHTVTCFGSFAPTDNGQGRRYPREDAP